MGGGLGKAQSKESWRRRRRRRRRREQ